MYIIGCLGYMSRRFQTTPVKRWVHLINHESSGSLNLNQPGWFNGKLLDWRHFSKRKVGSGIPFETPIFCLSPFRIQICPRNPGFPLQSYCEDGTFRPSILRIFGRGLDSKGRGTSEQCEFWGSCFSFFSGEGVASFGTRNPPRWNGNPPK